MVPCVAELSAKVTLCAAEEAEVTHKAARCVTCLTGLSMEHEGLLEEHDVLGGFPKKPMFMVVGASGLGPFSVMYTKRSPKQMVISKQSDGWTALASLKISLCTSMSMCMCVDISMSRET